MKAAIHCLWYQCYNTERCPRRDISIYQQFTERRSQQLRILTPRSTVLSEKLVKWLPAFYGTRRFVTVFTSAQHLFLSWARAIHFMPPHATNWRSILLLYSYLYLRLSSCHFPLGLPTEILYAPLLFPITATYPVHLILLHSVTQKIGLLLLRIQRSNYRVNDDLWFAKGVKEKAFFGPICRNVLQFYSKHQETPWKSPEN